MAFPKTVTVRGVSVPVDSWEELKGLIEAFSDDGDDDTIRVSSGGALPGGAAAQRLEHALSASHRVLLERFVDSGNNGVSTENVGLVLGKRGKGARPALERWSRDIGLVTQDGSQAFQPTRTPDGRGFRMLDHYRRAASAMLGRKGSGG